jgi:hypothetical protein
MKEEKLVKQFEKWCGKQSSDYCVTQKTGGGRYPDCIGCCARYFANKIVKLEKEK